MSVIGRLDKQVARVLIAPLEARRDDETNARQPRSSREADATAIKSSQIERETGGDGRDGRSELPVWLL